MARIGRHSLAGLRHLAEPFIGAVVLILWTGAYALVFGAFLLVLAFQLNSKRKHARATRLPRL